MATAAQAPPNAWRVLHSWIANREVAGEAGLRQARNPFTGQAFAEASLLSAEQVSSAISAAQQAFPSWSALSCRERGRYLLALRQRLLEEAEEVAELVAEEQGKPVAEAHLVEIFPSLECLKHLGERAEDLLGEEPVEAEVLLFAHKECQLLYAPYGVVLIITPWNYPVSIALTGVAAALAAGNTVVLKPAPATTLIGIKIGELCRDAGLPPGVVNVLAVDDALAPGLVEDPRLGKIVFTGSVATGKKVMAAAAKNLTPVVLELGGKDPAIVCQDANLEQAARGIVWGAFLNAGQTCASVERVYVEAPVAEAFIARVVGETRALRLGDPREAEVDVGPMTLERQRAIVEEHVADAVAKGARVLTGGIRGEGPGTFYPPTVLVDVDHTMRIMREETFGPVLPVMRVESLDDAIRLANDSDYGLTASGWTQSAETAGRLQRELAAGVVTINDCVASFAEPSAPWGGVKHSGLGRTHGLSGLREMVQVKYLSRDTSRRPLPWWFPYGGTFRRLMMTYARAFHSRSLFRRLLAQGAILTFGRFWKRANLRGVLLHLDKLF